jgi:hypothetical protein
MSHPLVNNLGEFSDDELTAKLHDLTRKYYQSHNPDLKHQMQLVIDDIQHTLTQRRMNRIVEESEEMKELDNLINIR